MGRKDQTSDAQLLIGESRDSGFALSARPGMTSSVIKKLPRALSEADIADVIDRMAKGHSINRIAELLPWNWRRSGVKLGA
jgi:hypothetical protein